MNGNGHYFVENVILDFDDVIIFLLQAELKRVIEKCLLRKCAGKNVRDMNNIGAFRICYKNGESDM